MKEEWKEINGFNGRYSVSNLGRIKSKRALKSGEVSERILSPNKANRGKEKTGVPTVALVVNSQPIYKSVAKLVAEYFVPNPYNKDRVINKDDNPENMKASNLEWVDKRERAVRLHALNKTTSSKYTGVAYHKTNKKWIAYAPCEEGQTHPKWLGTFETEAKARKARKDYVIENKLLTKYDKL